MAYEHLYQGRKAPTHAKPARLAVSGLSMIEDFKRRGQLPDQDASGGQFTPGERQQAREIRLLMAEGRWGIGNVIPHKLMPLVYDGAMPEHIAQPMQSAGGTIAASYERQSGGSVVDRLAQKIELDAQRAGTRQLTASLATDGPRRKDLATDQPGRPRNDLATDHAQRIPLSAQLSQIMQRYQGSIAEEEMDEEFLRRGITDTAKRIALKSEAVQVGLMRPNGVFAQQAMTYRPGMMEEEGVTFYPGAMTGEISEEPDGLVSLRLKGKLDPDTVQKMRKLLQPKNGKVVKGPDGQGLTLQASSDGFAAEGTGIWVRDNAHASRLDTLR